MHGVCWELVGDRQKAPDPLLVDEEAQLSAARGSGRSDDGPVGAWARSAVCICYLIVAWGLGVAGTSPASAQQFTQLTKATSSRAAKADAIRSIPYKNLSREAQKRLALVMSKPTMYRRMPLTMIQCDPELHRFAIRHPEVIVNIWQLMGITQVTAERIAPYVLKCNDGVGTITDIELIYGDQDTHILLCEGSYEGPLFRKPLQGRCVLVLRSGAVPAKDGFQITNQLDIFLQIDHAGLDIFAKTLHPLLGKSADVNFTESMKFVERMSHAAATNNSGMQHMVSRLDQVQPVIRQQFAQVVDNVYQRQLRLEARNPTAARTRLR